MTRSSSRKRASTSFSLEEVDALHDVARLLLQGHDPREFARNHRAVLGRLAAKATAMQATIATNTAYPAPGSSESGAAISPDSGAIAPTRNGSGAGLPSNGARHG